MSEMNRYQAPGSRVDGGKAAEYGEVKIFGVSGRVGRVRYLAYSFGVSFIALLFIGLMSWLGKSLGSGGAIVAVVLSLIVYIFMLVYSFMVTIQRAHDFNTSGWMSLLLFVPLVSLIFLFIPGTKGENNYGSQPPPNSAGNIILALVMPLIVVIGIVAAVAIPAYQGYIKQAQQMEQMDHQQVQQQLQQQQR